MELVPLMEKQSNTPRLPESLFRKPLTEGLPVPQLPGTDFSRNFSKSGMGTGRNLLIEIEELRNRTWGWSPQTQTTRASRDICPVHSRTLLALTFPDTSLFIKALRG